MIVVGAGGGLIKPMQARWEDYLERLESEGPNAKAAADERAERHRAGAGRRDHARHVTAPDASTAS